MNCDTARAHLTLYLYQELDPRVEEALESHLDACPACRTELEKERALQRAADLPGVLAEPSAGLLEQARRELDRRLALPQPRPTLAARAHRFFLTLIPNPALLRAASAALLFAAGFFGARLWDRAAASGPGPQLRVRAVQPAPDGTVRLQVDEIRQRTLMGRPENDEIRRLLVSAISDASDAGLRVQSLDLLGNRTDSIDVRRALRGALRDPNDAVRLKAIESMRNFSTDPETRRILARIVLGDGNPGVRTGALDLLVEDLQADSIGTLQELILREDNPYLRQRTVKALRAVNASVEPF